MTDTIQLSRTLAELEQVLDFVEEMNLRKQSGLPDKVVRLLQEHGIVGAAAISPSELVVKILDRQQELRRGIAAIHRAQRPSA